MVNSNSSNSEPRAPVYIPFKSFETAIATLEQGLPPILDRSVWPSFSGGFQSQTLGAFKFLGLIDNDGKVQPILEKLVKAKGDDRKVVLREVIQKAYEGPLKLAESNVSFQQLQDYFRIYKVKPGTLYRIISFFLDSCKYTDLKCSPLWAKAKKTIRSSSSSSKRSSRKSDESAQIEKSEVPDRTPPQSNVKTVTLRSGGTLSLSLSVDLISLTPEDRKWLFDLIDQLNKYGQATNNEQK